MPLPQFNIPLRSVGTPDPAEDVNTLARNLKMCIDAINFILVSAGYSYTPGGSNTSYNSTLTNISPSQAPVGATLTLTGTNLNNVTQVRFNDVIAGHTLVSATQLTTVVPVGATSGLVTITVPDGTLSISFTLGPDPNSNTDLLKNSEFTAPATGDSATGWRLEGAVAITGGQLVYTGEGDAFQNVQVTAGLNYEITAVYAGTYPNHILLQVFKPGGNSIGFNNDSTGHINYEIGSFPRVFTAGITGTLELRFRSPGHTFTIDSLSVKPK